jgi:hypothetical protein
MSKPRVTIPVNQRELIDLCLTIAGEHKTQNGASPLGF